MAGSIDLRMRRGKLRVVDMVSREPILDETAEGMPGRLCRLRLALLKGDPEAVKQLLADEPVLMEELDSEEANLCHDAALGPSLRCLQMLAERGLTIDQVSRLGRTPLCEAAYMRRAQTLAWLLDQGALPNREPAEGDPPVFESVQRGFFDGFLALIEQGAPFDRGNPGLLNRAPLHWVARAGEVKIAQFLLERGADVDITDQMGKTPLFEAAEYGQPAMVRTLLAYGADLERVNEFHQTPVEVANSATPEVLRILIEAGAELTGMNRRGRSVVAAAAKAGDLATVQYLVERGFPLDPPDAQGQSALQAAVAFRQRELVDWLIEAGADPNYCDARSEATVLLTAVESGEEEMVARILQAGAKVNGCGSDRESPLLIAASRGLLEISRRLLREGADAEQRSALGFRPLMVAASTRLYWKSDGVATEVVRLLCERGVQVDAVDRNGWSALHHAAFSGHAESAEVLLEFGADPARKEGQGKRPLDLALEVPVPHPYEDRRWIVPATEREDPQVAIVRLLFETERRNGMHHARRKSLITRARQKRCPQLATWMMSG